MKISRYGLLSDIKKMFSSTIVNFGILLRYKLGGKPYGLNLAEKRDKLIIISLTTIPSRLKSVQISLDCILRQTVKPDKVIVNLGKELFEQITLPKSFKMLENRGVEFRYVDYLCAHTKYFYTMQQYPEDIIITIDDDIIYKKTVVEELLKSYKKHPQAVSCLRVHKMLFDEKNILLPYNEWEYESSNCVDKPSLRVFATGGSGALYPPHVLYRDVFKSSLFTELCYTADDVWLKTMEVLNRTPVVLASAKYRRLTLVKHSQKVSLKKTNIRKSENDLCIKNVFKYYDITYSDLTESKQT